jgi:hypothetical protein
MRSATGLDKAKDGKYLAQLKMSVVNNKRMMICELVIFWSAQKIVFERHSGFPFATGRIRRGGLSRE